MKINVIALSICGGSLLTFIGILIFYLIKIHAAKKVIRLGSAMEVAAGRSVPKPQGSYFGVLVSASILILLPILVPMKTYFIAVVCCCAIMAEIIALRDRLAQLTGKTK